MRTKGGIFVFFAWLFLLEASETKALNLFERCFEPYTQPSERSFLSIMRRLLYIFQPRLLVRMKNNYLHILKVPYLDVIHVRSKCLRRKNLVVGKKLCQKKLLRNAGMRVEKMNSVDQIISEKNAFQQKSDQEMGQTVRNETT